MSRKAVNTADTIFALTSGALPSGVAVIKVSGPFAFEIAKKLFPSFRKSKETLVGSFVNAEGRKIDKGILLQFFSPASHTGEDVVEFHLHGSKAVVLALEHAIERLGGRRAEPGEFSYRALIHGKTTPNEIEDLADVYGVQNEEALQRIYGRRDKSLEDQVLVLREGLIKIQAILDTAVDFSDEYSNVTDQVVIPVRETIQKITEIIQRYQFVMLDPVPPKIVIAGRPNVGKSSLFNSLLCRERAITDSMPGTTRDVIEEQIALQGRKWGLVDTAGLRSSESRAERQGISLGSDYLSGAEFWLLVVDGQEGLKNEDYQLLEKHLEIPHRIVWNKKDLMGWGFPKENWIAEKTVGVSARTGEGIPELIDVIVRLTEKEVPKNDRAVPTRAQVSRLQFVLKDLADMIDGLKREEPPEYLAELSRLSIQHLSCVLGEVTVEEVLGRVFNEFCIGK